MALYDRRTLEGVYSVRQSVIYIQNYRYAEERMMRMMAGWIALTPELAVKLEMAKQVYEDALHTDALGKRLPELRCGRKSVAASESPNPGFAQLVQAVTEPERPDQTIEKLVGVFDVLKPHLIDVYERTALETDQIADAPTIEILEDVLRRTRRHVAWGQEVLERLCDTDARRERRRARAAALRAHLIACGGVTGDLAPGTA